jgi:hypothetical protein
MSQPEGIDDLEVVAVRSKGTIDPLEFKQRVSNLAEKMSCDHDFPKWSPGIACFKTPAARKEKILDAVQERSWIEHDSSLEHLFKL